MLLKFDRMIRMFLGPAEIPFSKDLKKLGIVKNTVVVNIQDDKEDFSKWWIVQGISHDRKIKVRKVTSSYIQYEYWNPKDMAVVFCGRDMK